MLRIKLRGLQPLRDWKLLFSVSRNGALQMKSTRSAPKKLKMYSLYHIDFAVLFEAVLESAPQFIIQLFAISVQEEPAAIMQIISLPISFLNQAWAFTTTDKRSLAVHEIIPSSGYLNVKHQLALYELTYFLAVDCSPSVISPSATSGGLLGC